MYLFLPVSGKDLAAETKQGYLVSKCKDEDRPVGISAYLASLVTLMMLFCHLGRTVKPIDVLLR